LRKELDERVKNVI